MGEKLREGEGRVAILSPRDEQKSSKHARHDGHFCRSNITLVRKLIKQAELTILNEGRYVPVVYSYSNPLAPTLPSKLAAQIPFPQKYESLRATSALQWAEGARTAGRAGGRVRGADGKFSDPV